MWTQQTLNQINQNITVDLDVNSGASTFRKIRSIIICNRYDYNNSPGFLVQIGRNADIQIPVTMLKNCYNAACDNNNIYNRNVFEYQYPKQTTQHGCHVHVVGMIFYHAGLIRQVNGGNYILF